MGKGWHADGTHFAGETDGGSPQLQRVIGALLILVCRGHSSSFLPYFIFGLSSLGDLIFAPRDSPQKRFATETRCTLDFWAKKSSLHRREPPPAICRTACQWREPRFKRNRPPKRCLDHPYIAQFARSRSAVHRSCALFILSTFRHTKYLYDGGSTVFCVVVGIW